LRQPLQTAEQTHVGSGSIGVESRRGVGVRVLDVWADERNLWTAQHHDECVVCGHKEFDEQLRAADRQRDLQLKVNSAADHHYGRVVVAASLDK